MNIQFAIWRYKGDLKKRGGEKSKTTWDSVRR